LNQVYCGSQSLLGIEAIIFDKDGTLADSAPFLKRLAQARSQRCAKVVTAQLQACPSDLANRLLATLGVREDGINPDGLMAAGTRQSNIDALAEELLRTGVPSEVGIHALVAKQFVLADGDLSPKVVYTPPFPGTQAMLQRLRQSEIKLGILSSDSSANIEDFLRHYDLFPWIDDWQGTEPNDSPKPHPALLRRLCERLAVNPHQVVIVGDSWVDQALADQARTAGFISVSEAWGRPPVAGSSLILRDWTDLKVVPQRHTAS
jgi:phosphoglycolate phosphatase